jgi:Uma2 family endonuclease
MGEAVKRRATYEDLAVPANLIAEIIHGVLVTQPRPASRHALATSVLSSDLGPPFHRGRGGPGGWALLYEPELHLHGDILVPDMAGWRRERMPEMPDAAAFDLAPDWVCEVLSPSTAATDRAEKMPIYAREGVRQIGIVDPGAKTLEAYRRDADPAATHWVLLGAWRDDAKGAFGRESFGDGAGAGGRTHPHSSRIRRAARARHQSVKRRVFASCS